mgnify:CR=1
MNKSTEEFLRFALEQERGLETELSAVQEFEQKFGIPVAAAATLDDLVDYLASENRLDLVALIADYRKQYGVKPSINTG